MKGGTLSLDLITATVRLEGVKATGAREETAFKEGHLCTDGNHYTLSRKVWCANCDTEVPREDIVKLRQVDGGFAVFAQDEIAELKEEAMISKPKLLPITPHEATTAPPLIPSGGAYYIYPDVGCNMDAYSAIYDRVKNKQDMVYLTVFSIKSGSESMGRLCILNDTLALQTVLWPDEVATPQQVTLSEPDRLERARSLMDTIIEGMVQDYTGDNYKNQFKEVLSAAEKQKVPGEGGISLAELPVRRGKAKQETDFFALLEQVAKERGKKSGRRKPA